MKLLIDDIEVAWPKKIEIQVQGEFEEVPSLGPQIEIHGGKLWVRAGDAHALLISSITTSSSRPWLWHQDRGRQHR